MISEQEKRYYEKQICLAEIGERGQEFLKNSSALIIGMGGLGCPASIFLSNSGVGRIGICDFDKVSYSNLHRQILYNSSDIGKLKVEVAKLRLESLNSFTEIIPYPFHFKKNQNIIKDFDIILDCTDNFESKFLIHDLSHFFGKNLVTASIYQYEGQLQVFHYGQNLKSPCLRCLYPQIPNGCIGNCQQSGVLAPVSGAFGMFQAMESLKCLLGNLDGLKQGETLLLDFLHYDVQKIAQKSNPTCTLCSSNKVREKEIEVEEISFKEAIRRGCEFIDIRQKNEGPLPKLFDEHTIIHSPLNGINQFNFPFHEKKQYCIVCQKGIRSASLVSHIKCHNNFSVYSLKGGVELLHNENLSL